MKKELTIDEQREKEAEDFARNLLSETVEMKKFLYGIKYMLSNFAKIREEKAVENITICTGCLTMSTEAHKILERKPNAKSCCPDSGRTPIKEYIKELEGFKYSLQQLKKKEQTEKELLDYLKKIVNNRYYLNNVGLMKGAEQLIKKLKP